MSYVDVCVLRSIDHKIDRAIPLRRIVENLNDPAAPMFTSRIGGAKEDEGGVQEPVVTCNCRPARFCR